MQAAVVHLGVGLARRPRDPTHLSFAALALATAGYIIATWALHTATTVADYGAVWRGPLFVAAAAALVGFVWFFTFWTGFRPRLPAIALSIATGAVVVAHYTTPRGVWVSGITSLQQIGFLGEPMVLHSATETSVVVPALNAALFAYLIIVAADATRRRGLARTVPILAVLLMMLLGGTYDLLVDAAVIATPYLLPLAALVVVAIMGNQLLGEVRATESDLARHNTDLRSLVSAQTQDLRDVNVQLVHKVEQLGKLGEIARITTTAAQLESTLDRVLSVTGMLLGAERAEFAIRAAGGRSSLRLVWSRQVDAEGPVIDGHQSTTMSSAVPATSIASVAAAPADPQLPASNGAAGRHVLQVPVRSGDDTYGSLSAERVAPPYTAEERWVAETVAADVAHLVSRHELLAALRTTATLEERQRIARELHESVTQSLYAVAMMAEALPDTLGHDAASGRQAAGQIRELTLTSLAELRALLLELRPERIASMTLPALIRDEAALVSSRFDIDVDVDARPAASIAATTETKVAVYRVVRELLSNIGRHADATHVRVQLRAADGGGELTVADDGVGFIPDEVGPDHHGLAIARERLATVGGHLQLTSRPERGTVAVVRWEQREVRPAPNVSVDGGHPSAAGAPLVADVQGHI